MASKLSNRFLMLCSTLAAAGGCGQILGISDYDIDPKLDMSSSAGGEGGSGDSSSSGKTSTAGTGGKSGTAGTAGTTSTGGTSEGGQPPSDGGAGGEPPSVPTGGAPEPGTGGAGAGGADGAGGAGGEGGGPLGEVAACDSAECCTDLGGTAVGVELLQDGGFELGTVDMGDTPWVEDSSLGLAAITEWDGSALGFKPKTGTYFVYLSGLANESTSAFSEDVLVPADAGWMTVSGYRWFQIDAQDSTNTDLGYIALNSPTDTVEWPFYWTAPASDTDGWGDTTKWTKFEASWDAAPHQGETRYLVLHGESDNYPATDPDPDQPPPSSAYLFDDVSLKYYRCYK